MINWTAAATEKQNAQCLRPSSVCPQLPSLPVTHTNHSWLAGSDGSGGKGLATRVSPIIVVSFPGSWYGSVNRLTQCRLGVIFQRYADVCKALFCSDATLGENKKTNSNIESGTKRLQYEMETPYLLDVPEQTLQRRLAWSWQAVAAFQACTSFAAEV